MAEKKGRTVVISGQPGAGNTTVAQLISKKLGIEYFSMGQLFKDIGRGTYKNKKYYPLFKELCDKKGLVMPDMDSKNETHAAFDFWKTEVGKSKELHNVIDELQLKIAENGNVVMEGKLSIRMIKKADLVISTDDLTPETIVEKILEKLS